MDQGSHADLNLRVSNTGNATLHINNLSINDTQFTLVSANISGSDITKGSYLDITVRFAPAALGNQAVY